MLFSCAPQHILSDLFFALQLDGFLTPVSALLSSGCTKSFSTEFYLMSVRVFDINQIPVAAVALFMQEWTSQNEYRGNIATTLYLVFPAGAHLQPECGAFSLAVVFVNIFSAALLHFHLHSLPRTILICHCISNAGAHRLDYRP